MFVKQWKVNFFSMYFVRTKEEIHLSFKNSEKQRTQALTKNLEQHEWMLFSNVFIFDFEQGIICPLIKGLYQLRLGILF